MSYYKRVVGTIGTIIGMVVTWELTGRLIDVPSDAAFYGGWFLRLSAYAGAAYSIIKAVAPRSGRRKDRT